ncbi:MAG: hypothetical protein JF604_06595, partial [Bradyrhizobium sp.]|nr:hypothetical protein [Bradyrhizobium sp.]
MLLLIFLEHPTARLRGANAQGANWFPKNRLFNETVRYAGETDRFAEPTTLLNVAASVRNAMSLAGSLTFECSITFEEASRGSPSAAPISTRPGGAIRPA